MHSPLDHITLDQPQPAELAGYVLDRVALWPGAEPSAAVQYELTIRTANGRRPLAPFETLTLATPGPADATPLAADQSPPRRARHVPAALR